MFSIIKIVTLLASIVQVYGFPDGTCQPQDCTLQDWTQWGECSESCGENGVQTRNRVVLQEESCGGTCDGETAQTEPCNRQCCPKNCLMGNWYAWSCTCVSQGCSKPGDRIACNRRRYKILPAECGGYCDDRIIQKTCDKLCCYKDCVWGVWGSWAECEAPCEQPGTQTRERVLLQLAQCGGEPCDKPPSQEQECMGKCCPVDCVQGDWSHWSDCPATCGKANMTRTRYVEEPICDGKPCEVPVREAFKECEKYNNVDCKVSPWSQWTQCQLNNGRCGDGEQERIRSILVDSFCEGEPCPELIQKKNCSGPCCVQDCMVSEWTAWSFCSATCGTGISQRTRDITVEADCNGSPCPELMESRDCEQSAPVDCQFTDWSTWTACSTDCGDGVKLRSRTMLTPSYCGGDCSDSRIEEESPCSSDAAKRDCQVGKWLQWSACVRNCEVGQRTRDRPIVQQDVCGGKPCDNVIVSEWSGWGECKRNCQIGMQLRHRNVTVSPECGGQPCTNVVEASACHPKCEQLCNQGNCSCKSGYALKEDGYSCEEILCKWPRARHCPAPFNNVDACKSVTFECPEGQGYGRKCIPSCMDNGFMPKGSPYLIECQKNRTWTYNDLYCGLINRMPIGITVNATEIEENWPVGTCFAQMSTVTDNEPLDIHTYSIVRDTSDILTVKDNRLCLEKEASYENEAMRKFEVDIMSMDYEGESVTRIFHFTVLNANDPPRSCKLVPDTLKENSNADTRIGCLEIVDDDPGQKMSVSLLGSAHNTFALVKDEDKYCVNLKASSDPRCFTVGGKFCTIDYETRKYYYITVLVMDNGVPKEMAVFDIKIRIIDVNERPRKISLDPEDVLEEVEPGQSLAEVEVVDDAYQQHSFEILTNPSSLFSIKDNQLVAAIKLDHESNMNKQYTLSVKVKDNGKPPIENVLELVFGVGDVNEPPYDLHVTPDNSKLSYETDHPKVKENVKGEIIGTLSVYDPDIDEDIELKVISTYSAFTLVSKRCVPLQNVHNYCSAHIIMEDSVDYEEIQEFHITVMATDRRKVRVTNSMTVTVTDANDAPNNILLNGQTSSTVKVPEDLRSFTLATISAVDDDEKDSHVFFLSGEAASSFKIEGDQLMTSSTADLDFETHGTTSLIITAEDNGSPSQTFQKTFTISIIDQNEAPTDISLSENDVSEGDVVGTVIGTLSAEDPDNYEADHQQIIFTLPDDGRGRFTIVGNKLAVANPSMRCGVELCRLNFESESQIKIIVRATDDGKPRMSHEKAFTINIRDVNDPPSNLRLTTTSIRENMVPETAIGTINADDEDQGQTLTFEAINSELFYVNDHNHLVTLVPLNYEEETRHVVKLKVTDDGQPPASIEETMTISVLNVNEAPEMTSKDIVTVPEDTVVGSHVVNITVLDPDDGDTITATITKYEDLFMTTQPNCEPAEPSGTFCELSLLNLAPLDYDKDQLYAIPLVISDSKQLQAEQLLTVKILNVNDPPHDILLDGISTYKIDISENVYQADVATLSTVDKDKDQTHTYKIKYQEGEHFAISGDLLRLTAAADHELTPDLQLSLVVTDSGDVPQSLEKNITVIVGDVNEPPSELILTSNTVVENSEEDTVVGNLNAEDPDNLNTNRQLFSFHLLDSADGRFKVQGDQLMVAQSNDDCLAKGGEFCHLDYEKKTTHSIQVSVSDDGLPVKSNRFTLIINVTDANDVPRNLQLSGNEVEELAATGTVLGSLSVEDQDAGQTHTFSLVDDAGGLFELSRDNTVIKSNDDRLDNKITYKLVVEAEDDGSPPKKIEETFYLTVTGTEEAPRDISISSEGGSNQFTKDEPSLPENIAVNATIGTVTAVDNDPGSIITFELLDDADGHLVLDSSPAVCQPKDGGTICSTTIKISEEMDFESSPEYPMVVKAIDAKGMQSSKAFTVQVTNVNEAPSDVSYIGGDIIVSENHNGELLSVLTVVDPDKADDHTLSLTDDADGRFIISDNEQLEIAPDADLDYEDASEMSISVLVTDTGGLTLEKTFHVIVENLNEQPTSLQLSNTSVNEMSPVGSEVGQLIVTDPDNAVDPQTQSFTYTLVDNAGGRFALEDGAIVVAEEGEKCQSKGGQFCLLDYETEQEHVIAVEVSDSGDPPLSSVFSITIAVNDENDPPMDLSLDKTTIAEDMEVGEKIGLLSASDQDVGQELEFSITGGDGMDVVRVEGTELFLNQTVDYEEHPYYTITLTATDNGEPPNKVSRDITLTIANSNEPPTAVFIEPVKGSPLTSFPTDEPEVSENLSEETVFGQVVVLDPDINEEITAVIASPYVSIGDMGCLTLTKGTRCVANIRTEAIFNFEELSSFTANITVTDSGGDTLVQSFVFKIKDDNDPPQDILVNGSPDGVLEIVENSVDVVVAEISAVDEDVDQGHSFAVLEGPLFFYFVDNQLKLTTSAEIDFEVEPEFQLTLSVTDTGTPPAQFEKHITVKVTDENETPTSISLSKNELSEDIAVDTEVGTLTTDDPDNEKKILQRFNYTLIDDVGGRFKIVGDKLTIAKSDFNYEHSKTVIVKVGVQDDGTPSLSLEEDFVLDITNANDPPTDLQFSERSITEDAEVGKVAGMLTATDDDVGQTLSYSIVNSELLTIRDNMVMVDGQLNYETDPTITFTVVVSDDGEPSMQTSKNFTMEVINVNDAPHSLELMPLEGSEVVTLTEVMVEGEVVGCLVVEDEDSLERITLTLEEQSDEVLKLSDGGPTCLLETKDGLQVTVCKIDLILAENIDYETLTSDTGTITIEVMATDKGGLTISGRWEIPVEDSNDPPTDIEIDGNQTSIPENKEGYLIGDLTSIDEDRADDHIYQVLDYWEIFTVTSENGLVISKPLNFENQSTYDVRIQSVDTGKPPLSYTKTFIFTVIDTNEQPTAIALSHNEVSMAAPIETVIGFVEVTDPDNGDKFSEDQTFKCVASDPDGLFGISAEDNALRVNSILPAKEQELAVMITCRDSGEPEETLTSEVKLNVVVTADVPKSIKLEGSLEVNENEANVVIGTLSVVNALNQDNLPGTYTFTLAEGDKVFSIQGDSLLLKNAVDYEAEDEYHITIAVSGNDDKAQPVSTQEEFQIIVVDVNEPPQHIGIYSDSVPENAPIKTPIGDLNTVDSEKDQAYTYTIIGVADGVDATATELELADVFAIDGSSLVVGTANNKLDFEKSPIFSLIVETVDSGTPPLSYTGTVRVRVEDRNDAPTEITLDNAQIAEESPVETAVGRFSVKDEDEGQDHSCEVINIQEVPFKVVDELTLVVSRDELNHEGIRNYVVEVTCQDKGDDGSFLKVTQSFTINITNVNDAPYNISLSSLVLEENNQQGGVVATVSAIDPDSDKITYILVEPNDNFELEGDNTIVAKTSFNYEETTHAKLTIKVTDTGGLSATKEFEIKIKDKNEAPTNVALSEDSIDENTLPGTFVGTLRTVDEDHAQSFIYTLSVEEVFDDYFRVDGDTLVTGETPVDFESSDVYTLSITVMDNGIPSLSKEVKLSISVNDVNEAPTAIITQPIPMVPEDASVGLVLTEVDVEDEETDQSYSCQVVNLDTPFKVRTNSEGTMEMVLSDAVNYESTPSIKVRILCMDGPFEVTKDLTVEIGDVNEAPTQVKLDGPMLLPATGKPGYVIGYLTAVDSDLGQTHTFTVKGANSDLIQVKDNNALTLTKELPMKSLIDQASPEVVLTIYVVDNGQPPLALEQELKFPITNIDLEALKLPEITIDNKRVHEEAEVGTVIGALYNINMTVGDSVVFEIVEDISKVFEIKNNSHLVLASPLVGITDPSVQVTVQARNTRSQQTTSRTITIFIKKSIKCKKEGNDCDFDAKCIVVNATYEYCQCNPGFVGDGYSCSDFDDCSNASLPCQNGATCVDGLGNYSCQCAEGYAGKQCEIKESEKTACYDNECKNDAACEVDKRNSSEYNCACSPGWHGDLCEESVDDCEAALCYGEGECIDSHQTYTCDCNVERTGSRCEYLRSSCSGHACDTTKEICVPLFDEIGHACISQDEALFLEVEFKESSGMELEARLADILIKYGRFPVTATLDGVQKRSAATTSNVHPYTVDMKEDPVGVYNFGLLVEDSHGYIFSKTVTLDSLIRTCKFLASEGQIESNLCPSVLAAVKNNQMGAGAGGSGSGGGGSGASAGAAAGGAVVALIIILVIIIFLVKRHRARKVDSSKNEIKQNGIVEAGTSSKPIAAATSAIPPPPPPPPLPQAPIDRRKSSIPCPPPIPLPLDGLDTHPLISRLRRIAQENE